MQKLKSNTFNFSTSVDWLNKLTKNPLWKIVAPLKTWFHCNCTHTELHPQGEIFFLAPAGGSNPAFLISWVQSYGYLKTLKYSLYFICFFSRNGLQLCRMYLETQIWPSRSRLDPARTWIHSLLVLKVKDFFSCAIEGCESWAKLCILSDNTLSFKTLSFVWEVMDRFLNETTSK